MATLWHYVRRQNLVKSKLILNSTQINSTQLNSIQLVKAQQTLFVSLEKMHQEHVLEK